MRREAGPAHLRSLEAVRPTPSPPCCPVTARGKALRWLSRHRGITEQPPGSNRDDRQDGITKAQRDCANGGSWLIGQPWCGVWVFNALQAAGVRGISYRQASVDLIEQDARAKRAPYGRGWTDDPRSKKVMRGDSVVLFGRGVHVETVRRVHRRLGYVITDGGNTSSGSAGSQSNGGGSFRRVRPLSAVQGYALVDYPGGRK